MKKLLKHILIAGVLNACLISLLVYPGSCQTFSNIQVLFSPEQEEEVLQKLIDTDRNAEEKVYILIFIFTLDEVAEAIIEKYRQGLDVKIVMDKDQGSSKWAVTERLKEAGGPVSG